MKWIRNSSFKQNEKKRMILSDECFFFGEGEIKVKFHTHKQTNKKQTIIISNYEDKQKKKECDAN